MNRTEASELVGGLTSTSKMPCASYSIPAQACKTGKKLVGIKGSVCHGCYALKGFYQFPQGKKARDNRLSSLYNIKWVEAMVTLIKPRKDSAYFRWHDSGDIQGMIHLCNIMQVAKLTPDTDHWLPTKEYEFLRAYVESGKSVPSNMYVRVSAFMVDGLPPSKFADKLNAYENVKGFIGTSTVVSGKDKSTCPAYDQGGQCGSCRTCWEDEPNVAYPFH